MAKQQYNQQYRNAGEQATGTAIAVVERLKAHNFALTTDVRLALLTQGFGERDLPVLASACVAVNVSPNLLRYSHNLPPVMRVMEQIRDYGYRSGDDFHVSVFNSNVPVLDEDGCPTGQKAKAPTVVVMPSESRALENMKEHDRLHSVIHHIETDVVEDRAEAERIFNAYAGAGYAWHDEVVVAVSMLYSYLRNGMPLGSGKPSTFYGFFLPYIKRDNGVVEADWLERQRPKLNYTSADIAKKRARVKAARAVTKTNYPRDGRTADERLAMMVSRAVTNLAEAEHLAKAHGVSVETALIEGDDLKPPSEFDSALPVEREHEPDTVDGDILFHHDDSPPAPKAKPEPTKHRPAGIITDEQIALIDALGEAIYADGEAWAMKAPAAVMWASNKKTGSLDELWQANAAKLIERLEAKVRETYIEAAERLANVPAFDPDSLADVDDLYGGELVNAMLALYEELDKAEASDSETIDAEFEKVAA